MSKAKASRTGTARSSRKTPEKPASNSPAGLDLSRIPTGMYCGECLKEMIATLEGFNPIHLMDGIPRCKSRPLPMLSGAEIDVKFDALLRMRIEASGKDPSDNNNWEWHPASDGNKGYRTWKG